jgi:hypothetical protein
MVIAALVDYDGTVQKKGSRLAALLGCGIDKVGYFMLSG